MSTNQENAVIETKIDLLQASIDALSGKIDDLQASGLPKKTTGAQAAIALVIRERSPIGRQDIKRILRVSDSELSKDLKQLESQGKIRRFSDPKDSRKRLCAWVDEAEHEDLRADDVALLRTIQRNPGLSYTGLRSKAAIGNFRSSYSKLRTHDLIDESEGTTGLYATITGTGLKVLEGEPVAC